MGFMLHCGTECTRAINARGEGTMCVRRRHNVCQEKAHCVSGEGMMCVRRRHDVCSEKARCVFREGTMCVRRRHDVCQGKTRCVRTVCCKLALQLCAASVFQSLFSRLIIKV